eukprot:TRINITY_DN2779_c0_g1_i8.p1 TRINITY_DN2779_c0_g1~~TRINITY_DN2779_c0_g1_i8.p1  ORF type:complete len:500 (+),score=111.18 TRINITY_DN2779_c0_g1_i8:190-1500(+)
MEHYDEEDGNPVFAENMEKLLKYNPKRDPYVTAPVDADTMNDMDDFVIRDSDMVLIAGVSEGEEVSHLDIYVYESSENNLYIHHDYLLPAFPLSLAWLDYAVGADTETTKANMVAVGTFEPYIEIWDLDVVDRPTPLALLGGPKDVSDLGSEKYTLIPDSHKDSVLGLNWNRNQRNALASASADHTVKLWDLNSCQCLKTFTHHTDKVQSVQWNTAEAPILASGGFDSKIFVTDVRSSSPSNFFYKLGAEVEAIQWLPSPHHNHLLVSTEDGFVFLFDLVKGMSQPLWRMQAHNKPVHSIAVNPRVPGLLATGSVEGGSPLKLWDISSGKPNCLYSKTESIGPVFSLQFSLDEPFYLVIGSQSDKPQVVNVLTFSPLQRAYANFQPTDLANSTATPLDLCSTVVNTMTDQMVSPTGTVTTPTRKTKGKAKGGKSKK